VRVVAVSAALHIIIMIVLVAAGTAAIRPSLVDVEIVVPAAVTTAPSPPPILERGDGGAEAGEPIAERTPARRIEPARRLPHVHRQALPAPPLSLPPALPPAAADPETPPRSEALPSEPSAGDETTSGAGSSVGDGDGGGGHGGGDGDGIGALDLSARPVPLNASTLQTSLYTAEAQRDRVSGDVQLVLTIDPLGRVGSAKVRRGLGHGLDEIATKLALQIRFRPARDRTGKSTTGTVRWRFHFQPP